MFSLRSALVLAFSTVVLSSNAQKLKKADKLTVDNIRAHIGYLADDKLEGRRTGTNGEKLAMEYISNQFSLIGLQAKGTDGFYQAFEINEGKQVDDATFFTINKDKLLLNTDFFPFPFSPDKQLDADVSIAIQEPDLPWFFDLKPVLEDNKDNPHFDLNEYIRNNAVKAADRGATAVLLYNTSAIDDQLSYNGKDKLATTTIPVIYITKDAAEKYLKDPTATLSLSLKVALREKKRTGHNVIGYIDNGAATTVVLGAHFDHLGYGEDGNSMLRTGERLIHNGADDNASGTAALIELGRILKSESEKHNNYLFIAFSGEELGLFGSKYFVDNPTIDLHAVNYMINMDMVGRLNDSTKALTIGGYGTSPQWASVINPQEKKLPFVIKLDSSGTGPSDHTSFYRKDLPVLFFFTGQHKDYHRPTDDADKINYLGELWVIDYIDRIIRELDKDNQKLVFAKTRETQMSTTSFKVTLGIMPDYTFEGTGVRADGVSDGRPAAKAGLKPGDVIVQLGEHHVTSLETYMQALNKFKKGDKTIVTFKRGTDTLQADLQF